MVCVGQIGTAHGVRGLVRLRSFTADPAAITGYGPLTDATGKRTFAISLVGEARDQFVAAIDGVEDRDAALALRGQRLYVPRDRLPPPDDDEFYHVDLIGLAVVTAEGKRFGTVLGVDDHGAGDVVEIAREDTGSPAKTVAVPFTRACFPAVEIAAGRLVIDPPAGLLEEAGDEHPHEAATGDDAAPAIRNGSRHHG